jgi:hypothetical protein
MRRLAPTLLGPACALALLLACFHAVLFGDEQFAYRDAAHFYYPLYLRVQQEWDAGRWPIWDPWQNAGMPLLGLPMAAVLYPGKLLYAALPYPWAARAYVIAHVALAWGGMFALARTWGRSATASGLAALAYAFGSPVLFQYCNVIFLVGAAWVPWGLAALDGLLRRGRRWGLPGLGAVLASQVLGGDPEAAYLTVLCGGGYALVLAARGAEWPARLLGGLRRPWAVPQAVVLWVAAVVGLALAWPKVSVPDRLPDRKVIQALLWGGIGLGVVWRGWRQAQARARGGRLGPMLVGLAGACALALALSAVQLLPSLEFIGRSLRAADDVKMDIYYFSVEPYRIVETVWPGAFGLTGEENRSYLQALPQWGKHALWTPSLYLGGLRLVLALGTLGMRDGPPWRAWLLGVLLVSLLASFGRFAGPLWWLRWLRVVPRVLGPHDPTGFNLRDDAFLEDGAGSPYGLLEVLLPGFGMFRYPGKLLTFSSVALAGLAGGAGLGPPGGRPAATAGALVRLGAGGHRGGRGAHDGRPPRDRHGPGGPAHHRLGLWPDRPARGAECDPAGPDPRRGPAGAGPGCDDAGAAASPAGGGPGLDRDDARPGRGQRPARLDHPAVRFRGDVAGRPADR